MFFVSYKSLLYRYHTDDEIKKTMAELENRNSKLAAFEVNDNEISREMPSLRVTANVSGSCLRFFCAFQQYYLFISVGCPRRE